MRTPTNDQAEGERRKDAALALTEARREVYVLRGRRALLDALLRSGTATADDVRAAVELPAGMDPRCLGAVPGRLAYGKIISPAGFVRSTRPEGHARWVQVWELANLAAALRWLADHPDLPDPGEPAECTETRQAVFFDSQETATPTAAAVGAA